MFQYEPAIGYPTPEFLNIRSGRPGQLRGPSRRPQPPLLEARPALVGGTAGEPAVTDGDGVMRFEARQLPVKTVARVPSEVAGEDVLFVRFSAAQGESICYLESPMSAVRQELTEVQRDGHRLGEVVVVGADALFEPRSEHLPGRGPALEAFAGFLLELAHARIPFVWRTRAGIGGSLDGRVSEALIAAGRLATVEVGIPSLEPRVCAALEGPRAAPPDERIRLAGAVSARGVAVRALVDPLVPMLTDQASSLRRLFEALADAGVHRVAVRYLVLTRDRVKVLNRRLSRMNRDLIKGVFADEPWRSADPDAPNATQHVPHKLLAPRLRRLGHQRAIDLGAELGIAVDVLDPPTEPEVLSRDERVERRERSRERVKAARRRKPRLPQLDLFGRKLP